MAVPLTVGICLMSEYPIMTGLYTVIFAGVISFVTYLFRPGNYTGTPGVAAGLAPALALGVHTFGIEKYAFRYFPYSHFPSNCLEIQIRTIHFTCGATLFSGRVTSRCWIKKLS